MAGMFGYSDNEAKYPTLVKLVNACYDSLGEFVQGERLGAEGIGKMTAELLEFFDNPTFEGKVIEALEPLVMEFLGEVV